MAILTETDLSLIKRYAAHPSGLGYVAEFSNQTFSTWFRDNWSIDIDDPKYEDSGTSKGNRLVSFCRQKNRPNLIISGLRSSLKVNYFRMQRKTS